MAWKPSPHWLEQASRSLFKITANKTTIEKEESRYFTFFISKAFHNQTDATGWICPDLEPLLISIVLLNRGNINVSRKQIWHEKICRNYFYCLRRKRVFLGSAVKGHSRDLLEAFIIGLFIISLVLMRCIILVGPFGTFTAWGAQIWKLKNKNAMNPSQFYRTFLRHPVCTYRKKSFGVLGKY